MEKQHGQVNGNDNSIGNRASARPLGWVPRGHGHGPAGKGVRRHPAKPAPPARPRSALGQSNRFVFLPFSPCARASWPSGLFVLPFRATRESAKRGGESVARALVKQLRLEVSLRLK